MILAILFFPGLAFVVLLTLALGALSKRGWQFQPKRVSPWSFDLAAAGASMLLAALGSAVLPWPFHPAPELASAGGPYLAWLLIEGAFLLPLLPGLIASDPVVNRATVREAQISVAGRAIVWFVIAGLLWQTSAPTMASTPGRLLLAFAGFLALPAALGAGPFAAERTISVAAAEHGLDQATSGWVRFARQVRGSVVFAALVLGVLPQAQFRPSIALVLWAAIMLVASLILGRLAGRLPRITVPSALHWCWWRALPVAVAGLVYLAFVQ